MSGQLNLKPLGALWCMPFPCSLQPPCLPSSWKAPGLAASLGKPCLPFYTQFRGYIAHQQALFLPLPYYCLSHFHRMDHMEP